MAIVCRASVNNSNDEGKTACVWLRVPGESGETAGTGDCEMIRGTA